MGDRSLGFVCAGKIDSKVNMITNFPRFEVNEKGNVAINNA